MPVLVQDLLKGRSSPLVVLPSEALGTAIDMMMVNDYSQLPVVDDTNKAIGMVTTTSALDAARQLGRPPGDLVHDPERDPTLTATRRGAIRVGEACSSTAC
jgi:hypothetical protein